jgi:hypothetical protein
MSLNNELIHRASEYAQHHGLVLGKQLGFGVHGIVFVAKSQPQSGVPASQSAIKVHRQEPDYRRERDVYLRLQTNGITAIHGCHVPELVRYDDGLLIIEMTIVAQPFVLDFAGAFLDSTPDFSDEVMAEWRAEKVEQFGSRWHEVEAIMHFLRGLGIHFIDVTPNNIVLPE